MASQASQTGSIPVARSTLSFLFFRRILRFMAESLTESAPETPKSHRAKSRTNLPIRA
jgi:hypothetical protein